MVTHHLKPRADCRWSLFYKLVVAFVRLEVQTDTPLQGFSTNSAHPQTSVLHTVTYTTRSCTECIYQTHILYLVTCGVSRWLDRFIIHSICTVHLLHEKYIYNGPVQGYSVLW